MVGPQRRRILVPLPLLLQRRFPRGQVPLARCQLRLQILDHCLQRQLLLAQRLAFRHHFTDLLVLGLEPRLGALLLLALLHRPPLRDRQFLGLRCHPLLQLSYPLLVRRGRRRSGRSLLPARRCLGVLYQPRRIRRGLRGLHCPPLHCPLLNPGFIIIGRPDHAIDRRILGVVRYKNSCWCRRRFCLLCLFFLLCLLCLPCLLCLFFLFFLFFLFSLVLLPAPDQILHQRVDADRPKPPGILIVLLVVSLLVVLLPHCFLHALLQLFYTSLNVPGEALAQTGQRAPPIVLVEREIAKVHGILEVLLETTRDAITRPTDGCMAVCLASGAAILLLQMNTTGNGVG